MEYVPLKLKPLFQDYLWGGTRLKNEYNKIDAPDITAESWELSGLPGDDTTVAEGEYQGLTLNDLRKIDSDGFWGMKCRSSDFPVLVKLIDAHKKLSIQVHPSDQTAIAAQREHGKAEMWYIVDSQPGAYLYLGLKQSISRGELMQRAKDGSICHLLNKVPVRKGDMYFILPGTIHAIGEGMVIAEIQQSSNTTFRLYDYERLDKNGQKRALHLERASEVAKLEPTIPEECHSKTMGYFDGYRIQEMFYCRYFTAYRLDVQKTATLKCNGDSFQHLLCVDGNATIIHQGKRHPVGKGDSYFMPAKLGEYEIEGACRILISKV